ncbi:dipeptidase PepV [Eggerthia catenaformis]|uniref:dipeptidase PepV n=1 Tax=Eggerthia catenaformis TaxID=31973 RepID=UPI0028EEB28F|nr:dipeptidase PepV [Eggerthia catenaformis]
MDFNKEVLKIKDDMLRDLKTLCLIPSVMDMSTAGKNQPFGKECRKALDQMLSFGQRDGFVTDDCDGYAGHIDIGEGDEAFGILGHLDVVPANPTGWKHPQYDCTLDGEYLYGRGVADDKGPLLAAYYAAKIVNQMDFDKKYKIRVIFGCNEENGSACVDYYFKHRPYPVMGFTPDADFPVVYGEKAICRFSAKGKAENNDLISFSGGTVINIVPGEATVHVKKDLTDAFLAFINENHVQGKATTLDEKNFKYVLKGKSAHASLPEAGINSISLMAHFLNQHIDNDLVKYIDAHFYNDVHGEKLLGKKWEGAMGVLTSNLALIDYKDNVFEFSVDMRMPHELTKEILIPILKEKTKGMDLEYDYTDSLYVDPNSELIQKLHNSYVEFTGDHIHGPQAIGGGTYAKEMPNCVAFGCEFPGRDNAMHQDDEHILLDDLLVSTAIYAKALYDLLQK